MGTTWYFLLATPLSAPFRNSLILVDAVVVLFLQRFMEQQLLDAAKAHPSGYRLAIAAVSKTPRKIGPTKLPPPALVTAGSTAAFSKNVIQARGHGSGAPIVV